MKKIISFLIVLALCFSFCACGSAETPKSDGGVDVDLTSLSSTMVYSEVYSIMSTPEQYLGKTVKISGQYYASYYDATQQYYHYVLIADATACCQQGIEFVLPSEYTFPDDYPENLTQIEVTGTFSSYDELGVTYYCLNADSYKIIEQ